MAVDSAFVTQRLGVMRRMLRVLEEVHLLVVELAPMHACAEERQAVRNAYQALLHAANSMMGKVK